MDVVAKRLPVGSDAYFQTHHLPVYLQDCCSLILQGDVADPAAFMAEYFTSVRCSQHVVGRDFSFVSGTPHNRASFLRAARSALSGVVEYGGELTQGDALSCLRLLCSNFSAGAVRNAWSSAVALHAEAAPSEAQQEARRARGRAPLGVVVGVVEVTFLYERFLMALRCRCFDSSKACCRYQELESDMEAVGQEVREQGWPSPPPLVMKAAVQRASLYGQQPCFSFTEVVRALCRSPELRAELQAGDAAARTASEAAKRLRDMYHNSGAAGQPDGGTSGGQPLPQEGADRTPDRPGRGKSSGSSRGHFRP